MIHMNLKGAVIENKRYLGIATFMMVFAIAVGASMPIQENPLSENPFLKELEPYLQYYKPYTPFTVIFLFLKNSLTAALAFLLGPLLLLFPAGVLLLNGFMVGFVGSAVANQVSIQTAFSSLVPHGIFELPALIFASAAGFRFGVAALRKASALLRRRDYSLYFELNSAFRLFIIAVALLLIAAVIETYVTPFIVGIMP
jgi:stage II sporulation protein M